MAHWLTLILVCLTCSVVGCATAGGRSQTVLQIADQLEAVAIGTPQSNVVWSLTGRNVLPQELSRVGMFVHAWVAIRVIGREKSDSLVLYRQWPHGLLLDIEDNDTHFSVPVREGGRFYSGAVEVIFGSDGRYKGFFAYSFAHYSKDVPDRLEKEKRAYIELGFEAEYVRAVDKMHRADPGGDVQGGYPKLPLSRNRAKAPP